MKTFSLKTILAITCLTSGAFAAHAQNFSIDWSTVDGGGGTCTGGVYSVSATIGQPEAGSPVDQNGFSAQSAGGNYTLVGGFWSVIQPGRPSLKIKTRAGQLVLSWPADATGAVVQSATQFSPGSANWSNFVGTPVRVGGEFELVIGPVLTPPNPIRFFRLYKQ